MYCITLFGGIPGCGKTELISYILNNRQKLFQTFSPQSVIEITKGDHNFQHQGFDSNNKNITNVSSPQIRVISVDKLCSIADQAKIASTMNGWRHFRTQLLEAAERFICEVCNIECHLQGPLTYRSQELLEKMKAQNCTVNNDGDEESDIVFLVEDNFYYKSMRYEWFQVARRDGLGFCQIYLTCPIEVSLERNRSRRHSIPEHHIKAMYSCMEYPDPEKNKWEKFSVLFDSTTKLEFQPLFPLIELVWKAMHQPAEMILNGKKIEAQIICSKSLMHQVDKILRKLAGEIITDLKEKNSKIRATNIKEVLEARRKLLLELKQGSESLPQNIIDVVQSDGINADNTSTELQTILRKLLIKKCSSIC